MIKKISALLLALVLCMSVVVMPASAYELGSSSNIAYEIQLDKEYYSAGETVTVSLYLHAKEGLEFGTGAIVIGCNSAVFDTAENVANDIKAGSAMSENAVTYYKDGPDVAWAWQSSTVLNNIITNNTAEENEKFDQFLKFAVNKQGSNGSHEFATNTKRGYSAEELNADVEAGIPFMTFQLKLRDDVADGTKIEIGVPTGPMAKNYTYMNYLKSPGTATTLIKTAKANSEVVWSTDSVIGASCDHSADKLTWTTVTASTCKTAGTEKGVCSCGEYETTRALPLDANNHEGPFTWTTVTDSTYTTTGLKKEVCACGKDTGKTEIIPLKEFVTGLKGQIRFHKDDNGAYAGTFDVRALATIPAAKFNEVFTADKATQKSMIKEVGFVFASGATVTAPSMDAVKGLVENGTAAAGYTKKTVEYISTSLVKDNYTFSCIVTDIPDAQKTNSLVAVGYIAWDSNNDGKVDSYAYYPTAQTISFETLYNTHYNTAFPQA